jgi:hypothetical protein
MAVGREYASMGSTTRANVILPDGKYLNHEIVNAGFAWWFRKYAPKGNELEVLESEARKAKRSLRIDREPVPPGRLLSGSKAQILHLAFRGRIKPSANQGGDRAISVSKPNLIEAS